MNPPAPIAREIIRHLEAIKRERDRPYEGDHYVAFVGCMARVTYHADAVLSLMALLGLGGDPHTGES